MFCISPTRDEMQAAATVAQSTELVDVRLMSIDAKNNIDMKTLRDKLYPELNIDLEKYDVTDDGRLLVFSRLTVTVYSSSDNNDKREAAVANINIQLLAEYQIPSGPVPEDIKENGLPAFAKFNGLYNSWPYFRSLLQQVTTYMGYPSFVLPVLIIRVEKSEGEKEAIRKEEK